MDTHKLEYCAERLEQLLIHHSATDDDAARLHSALSPLIDRAKSKSIATPYEWSQIPGSYYFNELGLRKYQDLESAYAEFKIEITGGESPVLKALRAGES